MANVTSGLTALQSNRFEYRSAPLPLYRRILAAMDMQHVDVVGRTSHQLGAVESANKSRVADSMGFGRFSDLAEAVAGDDRKFIEDPVFDGLTAPESLMLYALEFFEDDDAVEAGFAHLAMTAAQGMSRMFTETLVAEICGGEVAPPEFENDAIDVFGPNGEKIQVMSTSADLGKTWRTKYGVSDPDEVEFDYYVVVHFHGDGEVGTGIVRIDDDYETSAPIQARDA